MATITTISYASALILLYLCILLFASAHKNNKKIYHLLLNIFGMLPGFCFVLYGFYLFLTLGDRTQGLAVLTAGLLLEMGALQLKQILKTRSDD